LLAVDTLAISVLPDFDAAHVADTIRPPLTPDYHLTAAPVPQNLRYKHHGCWGLLNYACLGIDNHMKKPALPVLAIPVPKPLVWIASARDDIGELPKEVHASLASHCV
jgi:hypothetical protein